MLVSNDSYPSYNVLKTTWNNNFLNTEPKISQLHDESTTPTNEQRSKHSKQMKIKIGA